jgi:peptidylprolyl isomerase
MKGQKIPPPTKDSSNRPGQRQQERLQRLARRRRRQQRIISAIIATILLIVAGLGIWRYQVYQNEQAQIANQHVAATATVQDGHASATATVQDGHASATAQTENMYATQTAQVEATTPTPVVGSPTPPSDKPPVVDMQPVTQPDGLQYIDITQGAGLRAANGNTVSVIYTGWVQSTGQKFDSTYDDGSQPLSVTLGQQQVIPGFDEGLKGLRSGGTRRLIIPPELAYGSQGQGPIPPNATLIFDVTVVSIQ